MVVPLGVGIGDVIGVAKLAKSVITEIKKKNEALTEYRALLLELDLLAQILDQIDGQTRILKDSDNNRTDQFELIRACCEACREPLQKFLDKVSKFEPSLGVWATDRKAIKGVGRKIQWKVAYQDDVAELRAILMGYTFRIFNWGKPLLCLDWLKPFPTINLLMTNSDSFRAFKKDGVEKFHHLQKLVKEHHTLLESLSISQKTIGGDLENHRGTILDNIDQCKRQIIGLANTNDTTFDNLGIKIDEYLKYGAKSQRKIDGQVNSLRDIQAHATSQRNDHLSSQEVTAESPAKSLAKSPNILTNSLAIFMVILASSNAALSYKLTKQNGAHLQQYVAKAGNITAQQQEYEECHPVATPAVIFSHQAQSMKSGSLTYWGKDESWEALWLNVNDSKGGTGGPSSLKSMSKYEKLSFFFRVDALGPDYHAPPGNHGLWAPPDVRIGYTRTKSDLFRWSGGTVTHVGCGNPVDRDIHLFHSAMTVFTQNTDNSHLLCVPFDARGTYTVQKSGDWRPLAFRYTKVDNSQRAYSVLSVNGDHQQIAAPGSPRWTPQLLPPAYNCQKGSHRLQAGLIGSLPLLLALAAFSAPPTALIEVLTSSPRARIWKPHQYQYPAGRKCYSLLIIRRKFQV